MTQAETPARKRKPRKEAVRLGKEIYQRDILPQVEAHHFGEYVAIDVETGEWAVADTTRVAVERLRAQRPNAIDVLCERGRLPSPPQLRRRVSPEDRVIQGEVNGYSLACMTTFPPSTTSILRSCRSRRDIPMRGVLPTASASMAPWTTVPESGDAVHTEANLRVVSQGRSAAEHVGQL